MFFSQAHWEVVLPRLRPTTRAGFRSGVFFEKECGKDDDEFNASCLFLQGQERSFHVTLAVERVTLIIGTTCKGTSCWIVSSIGDNGFVSRQLSGSF